MSIIRGVLSRAHHHQLQLDDADGLLRPAPHPPTPFRRYAAKLSTKYGDVVRVYTFERISGAVWQVDMLAGNGSVFWIHPKAGESIYWISPPRICSRTLMEYLMGYSISVLSGRQQATFYLC